MTHAKVKGRVLSQVWDGKHLQGCFWFLFSDEMTDERFPPFSLVRRSFSFLILSGKMSESGQPVLRLSSVRWAKHQAPLQSAKILYHPRKCLIGSFSLTVAADLIALYVRGSMWVKCDGRLMWAVEPPPERLEAAVVRLCSRTSLPRSATSLSSLWKPAADGDLSKHKLVSTERSFPYLTVHDNHFHHNDQ